jgi:APA family basic amino acid/polyamine antiporter
MSDGGENQTEARLRPHLGLGDTVAVALAAMIGAGIYVALGEATASAGSLLPLAIIIGAVVASCNALSAAELGVAFPRSGGAYEFAHRLVAPVAGFVAGWVFLFAAMTASATYTLAFTSYLAPLFPGLPLRFVGVAVVVVAVAVNAVGLRPSRLANDVLVAVNVAVLLAFIVLAGPVFNPANLATGGPANWPGVLTAGALMFFAFTGYARPVTLVEEIKDPAATLPKGVGLSLAASTVLYLAVAVVALGAVGPAELGQSQAPLRAAMERTGYPIGPILISAGALIASTSVLLSEIWGMSRLAFAMGRRRDLPSALAKVDPRSKVPRIAVLAVGGPVVVLAGFTDLRFALEASSLALLIYYAIMNLSALRLEKSQLLVPRVVSVAGLAACVALAFSLPWSTALAVLGVVLVGLGYFYLVRPRLGQPASTKIDST